jgi:hypothetical protein
MDKKKFMLKNSKIGKSQRKFQKNISKNLNKK